MYGCIIQVGKILQDQKRNIAVLVVFCFFFEWLFAWVFFESGISKVFVSLIQMLPPGMTAFIGLQGGAPQMALQMLAFGYVHPVMVVSLSVLPMSIPSRYIAGEIELKTFDILLTRPIRRWVIPVSIVMVLVVVLIFEFSAMLLGTLAGDACFDLNLNMKDYLTVALTGFFFFMSMGAVSTGVSTFQSERGRALSRSIGLFVFLYFFDTIVKLSKTLQPLNAYSYFQLYQPGKLLEGTSDPKISILICLVIILVFVTLAVFRFSQRDL